MSFSNNKYQVIKNVISKELTEFIFNYLILKKDAVKYMYQNNIVNETSTLGTWKDKNFPNIYSHYADFVMETLLLKVMPIISKATNLDLIPTYSFARIYEKGSILKRHKDRSACEISTTLNLGGDLWSIFIDPTGNDNVINGNIIKDDASKGIKIDLEPSDMLIYEGYELEHWREQFTGNICVQVFLHYNNINGKFKDGNLYDKRPMLGTPYFAKTNKL